MKWNEMLCGGGKFTFLQEKKAKKVFKEEK